MSTNFTIDDKLMEEARRISGLNTKKEVVEEALRKFIQLHRQKDILNLRGNVKWEGDLDEMRKGRWF